MNKQFEEIYSQENQIQPWPFRSKFPEEKISNEGERMPISPDKKVLTEKMVLACAKLFENSNMKWVIDGGLSISLLKGDFIGEHRDLDLAVEASEIDSLEKIAKNNNYGLFVTLENSQGERMLKRVNGEEFLEEKTFIHWMISIDEKGKIQRSGPLDFVNIHLIKRDKEGFPLNESEAAMPEEWLEPTRIFYKEKEINVAHPAKTAYYKLESLRDYDIFDLKHLAGMKKITLEDLEIIDSILQKESGEKGEDFYSKRKKIIEMLIEIIRN